jgi:hypothetical protein
MVILFPATQVCPSKNLSKILNDSSSLPKYILSPTDPVVKMGYSCEHLEPQLNQLNLSYLYIVFTPLNESIRVRGAQKQCIQEIRFLALGPRRTVGQCSSLPFALNSSFVCRVGTFHMCRYQATNTVRIRGNQTIANSCNNRRNAIRI